MSCGCVTQLGIPGIEVNVCRSHELVLGIAAQRLIHPGKKGRRIVLVMALRLYSYLDHGGDQGRGETREKHAEANPTDANEALRE